MRIVDTPRGSIAVQEHHPERSPWPPLLLIHGAGGFHLDWPTQLRRAKGLHVLTVDLPGHGASTAPARQRVADYAHDLATLLRVMDLPLVILVGHSMGGAIAQQMALDHPERVAGLVLMSTGARLQVNEAILDGILRDTRATAELVMKWAWAKDVPAEWRANGVERLLNIGPAVVHGDYLACNEFDLRERVQEIAVPTLVLCGTADKMTPLPLSEFVAAQIRGAELMTFEQGGHMLPLEQAEAVTQAVTNWLQRHWPLA